MAHGGGDSDSDSDGSSSSSDGDSASVYDVHDAAAGDTSDGAAHFSSDRERVVLLIVLLCAAVGLLLLIWDQVRTSGQLQSLQAAVVATANVLQVPVPASWQPLGTTPATAAVPPNTLAGQLERIQTISTAAATLSSKAQQANLLMTTAGSQLPPPGATAGVLSQLDLGNGWKLVASSSSVTFTHDDKPHTTINVVNPEFNVENEQNGLVSAYMMQLTRGGWPAAGNANYPTIYAAGRNDQGINLQLQEETSVQTWIDANSYVFVYTQDSANPTYIHAGLPSS